MTSSTIVPRSLHSSPYRACPTASPAMSLETRRSTAASADGASKWNSPICERSNRPAASRTARSAVSSIDSPASGVPLGKTHVPSLVRPVSTTSRSSPAPRVTTPPAAVVVRTLVGRRDRSADIRSQQARAVDDEREAAVKELRGAAREHHAREENFKVLHQRGDLGVDRELERDQLLLAAHLDL